MESVAAEDIQSFRTAASHDTGYTGLSILHRIHYLYSFDVIKDLVFDAMHNLPLNIARQHLRRYAEEKILDMKEVDRRLHDFPLTTGAFNVHCLSIAIFVI